MRTTMRALSAGLLLAATALAARADTTTQTFTFGTTLLGGNIVLTTPVTFNKFDPVLGTLTGVTWTVSGNINYVARGLGGPQVLDPEPFEFVDTFGSVFWDTGRVRMQDTAQTDVATLTLSPEQRFVFITLPPNQTTPGYPGFQQFHQTPFSGTVNFAPGAFAQFTGTGTGNLHLFSQIRGLEQSCFTPLVNYCMADFGFNLQRPFTSTLTFTFTPAPTPEPEQVPLPAAALLGLGVVLTGLGHRASRRRVD